MRRFLLAIVTFACVSRTAALADVQLDALISDGMVLQQQQEVQVWGTSDPDENVVVRFRDQQVKVVAEQGRWLARVKSGAAGGPFELTISGRNTVVVKDVLVGEVWVCSGQSNMGGPFATRPNPKLMEGTANSEIRLFTVAAPQRPNKSAQVDSSKTRWQTCGPETLGNFSAVAYYFGRDLQKSLNVPVGLIHASYGGSSVTHWINPATLARRPEFQPHREPFLYNSMVAPLTSYRIRGVIWYQGEADVGVPSSYQQLFSALIDGWRNEWKQGDFPFLFVQIAPYQRIVHEPQESAWAQLREAQRLTSLTVPNTAMIVTIDCGHETDIHPQPKEPIGRRLALAARSLVYHHQVVSDGPSYRGMTIDGNKIAINFREMGGGLETRPMVLENIVKNSRTGESGGALHVDQRRHTVDVPLQGFTIAGDDQKFVNGEAIIEQDRVIVWNRGVPRPVAVRYGWADYPTGNLFNKDGLPASPFRTDQFPLPRIEPAVRDR